MSGAFPVRVEGSSLHVSRNVPLLMYGALSGVPIGAGLVAFGFRLGGGEQGQPLLIAGVGIIGIGLYFGLLRRGLIVDAEARQVVAWWKWLFFRGETRVSTEGNVFRVERFERKNEDAGHTWMFRVLLGDDELHTLSEHQGGEEQAVRLAKRMASHVGVPYGGVRECPKNARRRALQAKYALAPLGVLVVLMFGLLLAMLFFSPF